MSYYATVRDKMIAAQTAEQLLKFQTPQVSRREENPALVTITPRPSSGATTPVPNTSLNLLRASMRVPRLSCMALNLLKNLMTSRMPYLVLRRAVLAKLVSPPALSAFSALTRDVLAKLVLRVAGDSGIGDSGVLDLLEFSAGGAAGAAPGSGSWSVFSLDCSVRSALAVAPFTDCAAAMMPTSAPVTIAPVARSGMLVRSELRSHNVLIPRKDFLFDASNAFQATRTDDGTVKSEKLYCTQAPGFSVKDSNGVPMICEILVALQGRVDAARLFGQRLEQILFKLGARRLRPITERRVEKSVGLRPTLSGQ